MEGFRLFETIQDPGAVEQAHDPWRQALLWEKQNPAVLGPLDAYLRHYPDSELESISAALHTKQQHDITEANKERGFEALNNKDLGTAQSKFEEVLRHSPNDSNAIAGLGFVRLNQKRFSEALSLFERARTLAPQRTDVRVGYENAKFWLAMQQASVLQQNNSPAAIAAYDQALAIRPQDEGALLGMAQALLEAKRFSDAEARFQQVLLRSPSNVDAKAGLGFIRLKQGQFDDAQKMLGEALRLAPQRKDIDQGYRNARYWGVMKHGAEALNSNRVAVAVTDYQQALALNPDAKDALLGLAQARQRSGNYTEAVQAYRRLTTIDSGASSGWLGLIHSQLGAHDAHGAIATLQLIPEATRQQMERRPDYLAEVALAYYSAHQATQGDQALRRALDVGGSSDTEEALNFRLQLAGVLMNQGNASRAIEVYKQATQSHPNSVAGWQGLVGAYTHVRDFSSALAIIRAMPANARAAAANDSGFLNAEAAAYSATGQCAEAEDFLRRSVTLDHTAGRVPAESTQLLLADILRREAKYDQARQGYREVIDRNAYSMEAWQGYITALHSAHADKAVVTESARMPAALRNQLAKDANFLVLLASAQRSVGNNEQVVQLLEQARSRYQEQRQITPADLDLQLAWAMAATSQHDPDLLALLTRARTRTDLTTRQHEAFNEIWSIWSVRRAQQALDDHKSEQGIAILLDAERMLPGNRRIQSALGATYVRQHEYHKALAVYESWRMAGANAGDYRAAAGAALAVHNDSLADLYLEEGIQQWPRDPELLRMVAKQEVVHGKYDDAKRDLKLALTATRESTNSNPQSGSKNESAAQQNLPQVTMMRDSDPATSVPPLNPTNQSPATGCRTTPSGDAAGEARLGPISYARRGRARLVDTAYVYSDDPQQAQQTQQAQQPQQPQDHKTDSADAQQSQDGKADATKEQGIQDEIDVVQNRNTPFTGLGNAVTGRTGDPGFSRLITEDGAVSDSITFANRVRMTVEGHGVYLQGGRPDGGSTLQFGTLKQGAPFGEQKAFGFGGDLQLSTNTFGLDFGTSPQGFLTHNLTGGLRFRPLNGPLTFLFVRDSVKDSLLSYAGARDPLTGQAWGGVVSNTGTLQLSHDLRGTGQYVSMTYGFIQGVNVPDNWKVAGSAGVYWRVAKGLSVGLSGAGMHYDRNLSFFSLGQGGYFSPQQYYLAAIPVSWFSRHRRFEYEIRASLGVQYLSIDSSPVFPTQAQPSPLFYAGQVHTGPNYDFAVRVGYRIAPHWYLDTFATGNNAQNFATQTVGFTLRFLMHPLPTNTDLHVNSIPDWRGKQPFGIQ
jgi:tetratricopeptide (TPR) repeat protein